MLGFRVWRTPCLLRIFYDANSRCGISHAGSTKLHHADDKRNAGLYVHWPYCKKRCPYCNFNKYIDNNVNEERMRKCLLKELETLIDMSSVKKITSVFFGGGTPSLADPSTIKAVIDTARLVGDLDSSAEVSIEVNPNNIEASKLKEFKDSGVNRISLGLQSLCSKDLEFLGRDHSVEESLRCLKEARSLLPGRVSVDIIFGRPGQTKQGWLEELQQLLSVCDHHVSLYQLTPERGTQLFKQIQKNNVLLPSSDEMADLYKTAVECLENNGFEHYEVSNFAKEACYSHHNLTYWTGGEYIGIGPGAHSRLWMYTDDVIGYQREARTQTLEPQDWMTEVENYGHATRRRIVQRVQDRAVELLMTCLRTKWGISNQLWRKVYPLSLFELFASSETISLLQSEGLLLLDDRGLRATQKGLAVLDSLIVELVSLLETSAESQNSS